MMPESIFTCGLPIDSTQVWKSALPNLEPNKAFYTEYFE